MTQNQNNPYDKYRYSGIKEGSIPTQAAPGAPMRMNPGRSKSRNYARAGHQGWETPFARTAQKAEGFARRTWNMHEQAKWTGQSVTGTWDDGMPGYKEEEGPKSRGTDLPQGKGTPGTQAERVANTRTAAGRSAGMAGGGSIIGRSQAASADWDGGGLFGGGEPIGSGEPRSTSQEIDEVAGALGSMGVAGKLAGKAIGSKMGRKAITKLVGDDLGSF